MLDVTDAALRDGLTAALAVPRWVEDVASRAPFDSPDELLLVAYAEATPLAPAEIDQAIAHHPRIGEKPVGDGTAESLSRAEQGEATELADELAAGNAAYEARFGRVFIIRAAGRTRVEILAELNRRLELDAETELVIVGEQLRDIAMIRLQKLFGPAETLRRGHPMSHVTTHVLDNALGSPAAGVAVALSGPDGDIIATGETDADGRVAYLGPEALPAGDYRIEFQTGAYFAASGRQTFFPRVTIEFILADAAAHYHVPLLISPFAYSTYRGS
jgi:hydroxyisourate hydrolase